MSAVPTSRECVGAIGQGNSERKGKIPRFEQIWFAGNHAEYEESESRLSDIALRWMLDATQALGDEKLLVNEQVLALHEDPAGKQQGETRSLAFRLAGKSDRDPVVDATLHHTVAQRFAVASGVLQYDVTAPYRPEALRGHHDFASIYSNVPLPHATCGQRIRLRWNAWQRERRHRAREARRAAAAAKVALQGNTQPRPTTMETPDEGNGKLHLDRLLSCVGLAAFIVGTSAMLLIWLYQLLVWLESGVWHSLPLGTVAGSLRYIGEGWAGLQILYGWLLALPLSLSLFLIGFLLFWRLGALSASAYKRRIEREGELATPAQTHA
jgi:hypothetical protein